MSAIALTDHHHDHDAIDVFGFWLFIMTDCILFGSLFATFLVLHYPGAFGPSFKEHVDLPYTLGETLFLLASNFAFGLAALAANKNKLGNVKVWLLLTFILGAGFVAMEINEFCEMYRAGYSWHASGAASAFFTLVGTHGLHVSFGLLWIAIMIVQLYKFGLDNAIHRRLVYLGLFWNFLDLVWIFLFSTVYLMGVLQ